MGGYYPIETYYVDPRGDLIRGSSSSAPPHSFFEPSIGAPDEAFGIIVFFPRGSMSGRWTMNVYVKAGEAIDAPLDVPTT
jgi:hypothetical protein